MYIIEKREWYVKHNKCFISYLHTDYEFYLLETRTKEHAQKRPFKNYFKAMIAKYKYLITNLLIKGSIVKLKIIEVKLV